MSPKEYSRRKDTAVELLDLPPEGKEHLYDLVGNVRALFPNLNPGIEVAEKPRHNTYSAKLKSWQQRRDLATTIRLNGGTLRDGVEDALAEEWELLKPHAECEAEHCPWHKGGE
jgi:hypothetical protein